jgi:hypothetical protein
MFAAYLLAYGISEVTDMHGRNPLAGLETTPQYRHVRLSLVRRFIGRKPTTREAFALDTATRSLVRAHLASADYAVSPDMLCKLNAAARHALDALKLVCAERPRPRRFDADAKLPTFEAHA